MTDSGKSCRKLEDILKVERSAICRAFFNRKALIKQLATRHGCSTATITKVLDENFAKRAKKAEKNRKQFKTK